MVDINLFKEEGEEEWKPNGEGESEGENLEDELGEDFDLGEEESEPSPLDEDDDSLLGDEEVIPDFDESDEKEVEEDYEYGETKEKRTPVWLWALLGVVLIGASLYLFWYQPRQKRKSAASRQSAVDLASVDSLRQGAQQSQAGPLTAGRDSSGITRDTTSQKDRVSGLVPATTKGVSTKGLTPTTLFIDVASAVFENLSAQGQLGTIILEGNKFHVGYVSSTPGTAQEMGQRIQRLIGAAGFQVSPEDRHRTAGKIQYWGVVSGEMPAMEQEGPPPSAGRFPTADSFINGVKELVQQSQLSFQQAEKFAVRSLQGVRQIPVRAKVEGNKANALMFLKNLKGFQGNYNVSKLTIAPVNISDFKASEVKLVLDFLISVG